MEKKAERMRSFKNLFKDSFGFFRSNFRGLVYFFLPIEIGLLVFALATLLYGDVLPVSLSVLISLLVLLLHALRYLVVFSGGKMCVDLDSEHADPFLWYKEVSKSIWSVITVSFQSLAVLVAHLTLSVLLAFALFLLPFFLLGLLVRVYPAAINLFSLDGQGITVGLFLVIFIAVVVVNIRFAISFWFSSYALILEKRKGLDALTSSFLYTTGRKWEVFWRLALLTLLAFLPAIILLLPIHIFILIGALKQLAITMLVLQTVPSFPTPPLNLSLWREGLGFVSALISLPLFVVFNYFLWKDVKATVPRFDEMSYTKTRKRIKIGVWTGAVIIALYIGVSIATGVFIKKNENVESALPDFGQIPPSGMMQ